MTSDGQEPTRNSSLMSGRRSKELVDDAVELFVAIGHPGQIAFLDNGGPQSAVRRKIITPAADWSRCAQVRLPTTRKNAS